MQVSTCSHHAHTHARYILQKNLRNICSISPKLGILPETESHKYSKEVREKHAE